LLPIAVTAIERRQLELCELLYEVPLTTDSNVAGRRVASVFAAFVEYLAKKNIGMVRNVQPAGLSGARVHPPHPDSAPNPLMPP